MGRTTTKDIFHPSHRLESCGREVGTSSGTSDGSKPYGSPVGPTVGPHTKSGPPTIFMRSRSVSKPMPEFDHYSLVGRTFLLHPEENGEKLTSTSLIAYLKYSFEDEFSTPNQSSNMEVQTLFLTLNNMKVATIHLPNGILRRNLCNLHSSRKPWLPRSFISFGFNLNTI